MRTVDKPWGKEEIWAETSTRSAAKDWTSPPNGSATASTAAVARKARYRDVSNEQNRIEGSLP